MKHRILGTVLTWALLLTPLGAEDKYEADVAFALEEIEKACGKFIRQKKIDWKAVSRQFRAEAKEVSTDQEHLVLLVRLLARLKDGHSSVRPLENGKDVEWPERPPQTGIGMFWTKVGDKVFVKNAWGSAKAAGVEPGMEILKIDKKVAGDWLDARIEELSDLISFSTPQQALFYATHWGLRDEVGKEIAMEFRSVTGRRKEISLKYTRSNQVPSGPAYFPKPKGKWGRAGRGDLNWCVMDEDGWGVHSLLA